MKYNKRHVRDKLGMSESCVNECWVYSMINSLNSKYFLQAKIDKIEITIDSGVPLSKFLTKRSRIRLNIYRHIKFQIWHALNILFSNNMVHRDIKLDNMVFLKGQFKLIDLETVVNLDVKHSSCLSTTIHRTHPEAIEALLDDRKILIKKKYDIWAMTVSMIAFLVGYRFLVFKNMKYIKRDYRRLKHNIDTFLGKKGVLSLIKDEAIKKEVRILLNILKFETIDQIIGHLGLANRKIAIIENKSIQIDIPFYFWDYLYMKSKTINIFLFALQIFMANVKSKVKNNMKLLYCFILANKMASCSLNKSLVPGRLRGNYFNCEYRLFKNWLRNGTIDHQCDAFENKLERPLMSSVIIDKLSDGMVRVDLMDLIVRLRATVDAVMVKDSLSS